MEDKFSPNATYKIAFGMMEVRMSHWIYGPAIYRVSDKRCLFNMDFDGWSADSVEWLSDSTVVLHTRKYPGRLFCDLTLDLAAETGVAIKGTYQFRGEPLVKPPIEFSGTLQEISSWL